MFLAFSTFRKQDRWGRKKRDGMVVWLGQKAELHSAPTCSWAPLLISPCLSYGTFGDDANNATYASLSRVFRCIGEIQKEAHSAVRLLQKPNSLELLD